MNRSPDSTGTGSAPPPDRQAGTPHLNGTTPDLGVAAAPDLDVAARAAEADLPTGPEKTALVRSMFDTIAPRYDLVNRMMTFGLDVRWRKQSARALGLPAGARVLDLACGTGDFLRILSAAGLAPFGMDLSWGMLRPTAQGSRWPRPTVPLSPWPRRRWTGSPAATPSATSPSSDRSSASSAGWSAPGDGSACSRWPSPTTVLLLAGHRIWFRKVVPVIGGLLSDRAAYRYLPRSTAYLPGTPELRSMLTEAGFSSVNRRPLSGGLSQLITATRAGRP